MEVFFQYFFYAFSFLSLYVQIYFLVVFLEFGKEIKVHRENIKLFEKESDYPTVSIVVPAYNEGIRVKKTVDSLLEMHYPKDKLFLILVDDGSKDNTYEVMKQYKGNPQIQIFTKPNGGKYTAQNLALEKSNTEFIGCLDADSAVHPEALKRIMTYFIKDKETMAVCPTIVPDNPKNFIEKAQQVEYELQIYTKKMYSFVGAIHVTPGPFSIFRKKVFDEIGPYRHAHLTEDQEIALRMQSHGMKIEHAPDAYVYTNAPKTIKSLFKQRVRWHYGFLRNVFDYRHLFFNKKRGNIGFINLPVGFISSLSVTFLMGFTIYNLIKYLYIKYITISATGLDFSPAKHFSLDPFYINTSVILFTSIFLYAAVFFSLYRGHKILHDKSKLRINILYFQILYALIGPFWLIKALFNAVRNYELSWTKEIEDRKGQ